MSTILKFFFQKQINMEILKLVSIFFNEVLHSPGYASMQYLEKQTLNKASIPYMREWATLFYGNVSMRQDSQKSFNILIMIQTKPFRVLDIWFVTPVWKRWQNREECVRWSEPSLEKMHGLPTDENTQPEENRLLA